MYLLNLCQQILRDMWAHKLRSFLALFCIMWGTVTVVLLLALGAGFAKAGSKNMLKIVDGTFFVVPSATSISYHGFPKGKMVNIKSQDIMDLVKSVPGIKTASPILIQRTDMNYQNKKRSREVYGVSASFAYLQKINIDNDGRFINRFDIDDNAFVVVLGERVKEHLFGDKPAVGKKVTINHIKFTVIGITQKDNLNVYNFYNHTVLIPYTTYISLFGDQNPQYFIVLPYPKVSSKSVEQVMRAYLAHKYHFAPNDKVALGVFDTTEAFQFIHWFFIGIQIFLGICGALTLGVGSLGVANIMFLIVSERTREIGVRMAIGAQSWHILLQIILEALIVIGLGGLIGFLLSYAITIILQYVNLPDWLGIPTISPAVVVTTIIILSLLGLLAGIFPARRAAKMDPVEALACPA
jgi:putative ABC transport system permease protein